MLLLTGVVITTVNLAFLWTQLPAQCACDPNLNPTRSVHGSVRMDTAMHSFTRTNNGTDTTKGALYELNSLKNGTETAVTPVTTSEDTPSPLSERKSLTSRCNEMRATAPTSWPWWCRSGTGSRSCWSLPRTSTSSWRGRKSDTRSGSSIRPTHIGEERLHVYTVVGTCMCKCRCHIHVPIP